MKKAEIKYKRFQSLGSIHRQHHL